MRSIKIKDASLHNLSVKQIEDYFDKEVIEKLGRKIKMSNGTVIAKVML